MTFDTQEFSIGGGVCAARYLRLDVIELKPGVREWRA